MFRFGFGIIILLPMREFNLNFIQYQLCNQLHIIPAQIEKVYRVANKPLVVTYTGLIQAGIFLLQQRKWRNIETRFESTPFNIAPAIPKIFLIVYLKLSNRWKEVSDQGPCW